VVTPPTTPTTPTTPLASTGVVDASQFLIWGGGLVLVGGLLVAMGAYFRSRSS
jgi:hypothetical protein